MKKLTLSSIPLAILASLALQATSFAGPATVSYSSNKKYIRACILLVKGWDGSKARTRYTVGDPWVLYLLDNSPMKPPGWEFINPLAKPVLLPDLEDQQGGGLDAAGDEYKGLQHKGGGWYNWFSGPSGTKDNQGASYIGQPLTKEKPAYWMVKLDNVTASDLANFDLIIVTNHHNYLLTPEQRDLLARAVDAGATLWIDNCRGRSGSQDQWGMRLTNFFLLPPVDFATDPLTPDGSWVKRVADPTHPLFNGVYHLTPGDIAYLGDRQVNDYISTGVGGYGAANNSSFIFEILNNAPGGPGTGQPGIAAGTYGSGFIVVSATDVMACINDWWEYQRNVVGKPLPPDHIAPLASQPAFAFAYNVVQWSFSWRGLHRNPRHTGYFPGELAPPLTEAWRFPGLVAPGVGRMTAGAVADRNLVFAPTESGVHVLGLDPRGRLGQLTPAGAPYDLLFSPLGSVAGGNPNAIVGSPALGEVFDSTFQHAGSQIVGSARQVAYAVVFTGQTYGSSENSGYELVAYCADAGEALPPHGKGGTVLWSYPIAKGRPASGPVATRGMVYVTTLTYEPYPGNYVDGHILAYDMAGRDPNGRREALCVDVALAERNAPAAIPGPVAMAMVTDEGTDGNNQRVQMPIEVAVVAGDAIPSGMIGQAGSQTVQADLGRLWVVPLRIHTPASDWNGIVGGNSGVEVLDSSTTAPKSIPQMSGGVPNYLVSREGSNLVVTFTRWGLFREYRADGSPIIYGGSISTNNSGLTIQYTTNSGNRITRPRLYFDDGQPVRLGSFVGRYPNPAVDATSPSTPMGLPSLDSLIGKAQYGAPCVRRDMIYVGSDAMYSPQLPLPTRRHLYGRVSAIKLTPGDPGAPRWQFFGERSGFLLQAPDPNDPLNFYSDFPFTPTFAEDSNQLLVVGQYAYAVHLKNPMLVDPIDPSQGPVSVLYALDPEPSPLLRLQLGGRCTTIPHVPNNHIPMDRQAPTDQSASPNFMERGWRFWMSSNASYGNNFVTTPENVPLSTIPERDPLTQLPNYVVDYENGQIRLSPSVFGEYTGRTLHVQYFANGQGYGQNMCVPSIVKWVAVFPPEQDSGGTVWFTRVTTSAVVAKGYAYLGVLRYDAAGTRTQAWIYALKSSYPDGTIVDARLADDPARGVAGYLWRQLLNEAQRSASLEPAKDDNGQLVWGLCDQYAVAPPALAENTLVTGTALGAGNDAIICLSSPTTLVADNYRLVEASQARQIRWAATSANELDAQNPRVRLTAGDTTEAGSIVMSNYVQRPLARVSTARRVAGTEHVLLADTGNDRVIEIDRQGNIVWQYPDTDIANEICDCQTYPGACLQSGDPLRKAICDPTPTSERLKAPTDARRSVWMENAGTLAEVKWEATLIADAGNFRVVEVLRPLYNGRYDPQGDPLHRQQIFRVITGPSTNVGRLMFVTAEVYGASTVTEDSRTKPEVLCVVGNQPVVPAGDGAWEGIRFITLVVADGNTVRPLFKPRANCPADLLYITSVEQVQIQNPVAGGPALWQTLLVDAAGVKLMDNATWNTTPVPVFEMVRSASEAPWLPQASLNDPNAPWAAYDEEIGNVAVAPLGSKLGIYTSPNCPSPAATRPCDAYAAVPNFIPTAAKRLPNGHLLIVNGDPQAFIWQQNQPVTLSSACKSEVLEVDARLTWDGQATHTVAPRGQRLFWTDGNYFIVPDPLSPTYPDIPGQSYNLKQPTSVDRY